MTLKENYLELESFAIDIEDDYYSYFPYSYINVDITKMLSTKNYIVITVALDTTNIENDPMYSEYFIVGIDSNDNFGHRLMLDTNEGYIKTNKGKIKFFHHSVIGNKEKILESLDKIFSNMYNIVVENMYHIDVENIWKKL